VNPGDRSLFPDLGWRAYLNHAAIGPLAAPTLAAVHAANTAQARQGVGAIGELYGAADRTRAALGRLVRSAKIDLALTRNTSDGVVAVALCHPWEAGQTIVLLRGEFPTNVTPWQRAAELHGLQLAWIDVEAFRGATGDGLGRLEETLRTQRVGMVAVSAVQFQTGLRMPLRAITDLAHAHGAAVCVDAIQALGSVPLSVKDGEIDYLASGGQKWLMGPVGTGLLYARRDRWQQLRPHLASWLSHVHPLTFLSEPDELRYDRPFQGAPALIEGGGLQLSSLAGLGVAAELAVEVGVEQTFEHLQRYHDALEPGLQDLGFTSRRAELAEQRSGILSLLPPPGRHVAVLVSALAERGVSVASPDGHLRFSPSWPNPLEEAEQVLAAVREVLAPPSAPHRATPDQALVPELIALAFGGTLPPGVQAVLPPAGTDFLGLRYKAGPILRIGGNGETRAYVANSGEDAAFVDRIVSTHPHPEVRPFFERLGAEARKMVDTDGQIAQLFLDDLHDLDHGWQVPAGLVLMCDGLRVPDGLRTWLSRHDAPPVEHLDGPLLASVQRFCEAGFRGRWGVRWREGGVYSVLYINEERWTGDPERSARLLDGLDDPRWKALRQRARASGWGLYPDGVELHADGAIDVTVGIFDPAEVARR
jgi:cysteine desulfurase/selenocysteine lyase